MADSGRVDLMDQTNNDSWVWFQVISEEHENKPVDFNQIADTNKHLEEVMNVVSSDQQIPKSKIAIWIDPLDATQEYTGTGEGTSSIVLLTLIILIVTAGEHCLPLSFRSFDVEAVKPEHCLFISCASHHPLSL